MRGVHLSVKACTLSIIFVLHFLSAGSDTRLVAESCSVDCCGFGQRGFVSPRCLVSHAVLPKARHYVWKNGYQSKQHLSLEMGVCQTV